MDHFLWVVEATSPVPRIKWVSNTWLLGSLGADGAEARLVSLFVSPRLHSSPSCFLFSLPVSSLSSLLTYAVSTRVCVPPFGHHQSWVQLCTTFLGLLTSQILVCLTVTYRQCPS